jgi:hypothetical protein
VEREPEPVDEKAEVAKEWRMETLRVLSEALRGVRSLGSLLKAEDRDGVGLSGADMDVLYVLLCSVARETLRARAIRSKPQERRLRNQIFALERFYWCIHDNHPTWTVTQCAQFAAERTQVAHWRTIYDWHVEVTKFQY